MNENQETGRLHIDVDRYNLLILAGSVLLVSGFGTWWYITSVVSGLERLVTASTTEDELWRFSGSLDWWRLQQKSLLNPLAILLIAIGVMLIGNTFFWLAKGSIETREGSRV